LILRSSYTDGSWKTSARREEENKNKRKEEEEEKERSKRREQEKRRKESSSSSGSESEPERGGAAEAPADEPQQPAPVLTETELNALAAKLMKAELMGNDEQAAVLRGRLEAARAARAAHVAAGGDPDTQTQV